MTIYLFIDLPFNEIGSYPTSLRDGEKKRRKKIRGGEGKAGLLLRGQPISCFSFRLLSTWIQSDSMSAGKYKRSIGLHSGWSSPSHISSRFSLFPSHTLILLQKNSPSQLSLPSPRPLCLTLFSIMRGPLLISGLWSVTRPLLPPCAPCKSTN